jgi:hypothetical protein
MGEREGKGRRCGRRYVFEGLVSGVTLEMEIAPAGVNRYTFRAGGRGAGVAGTAPLSVGLTIGDDSGTATARPSTDD